MATGSGDQSFDILLIEDNSADTLLVTQALSTGRMKIKAHCVRQPSEAGPDRLPILSEANSGKYDMIVLGAEHRAIHYRLFFGYDNEKLVEESRITVVLVRRDGIWLWHTMNGSEPHTSQTTGSSNAAVVSSGRIA